ncbi:MAG TPA: mycofactocin-associated electron transfer flavoprotein beta subunit [Acidimicrobiales bacterium]|jgi:electron transfer flavoprotein beta subunit|nr:mycofactocin-associated electron transfer flavoprotein beta subunit [Acidimicrobiales bacterium]
MDDRRDGPMVVACVRIGDLRPRVDPLTGAVVRDQLGAGLTPADAAALEYAFRVAGAWAGHVVVVTAAPPSADPWLREAVALGATPLRVGVGAPSSDPGYAEQLGADERAEADAIAAALAGYGRPALVLCGDRSADRGTGALPAFLAHRLGAAQALGLVALAPSDQPLTLVAERRLDGGWRERLRVACPAVCSVEGAGIRLRRASLTATLAAQGTVIPVIEAAGGPGEPGPGLESDGGVRPFRPRTRVVPPPESDDPRLRLLALTGALVAHDPPTVIGPVDASGAADALFDFLNRHGYLVGPTDREAGR